MWENENEHQEKKKRRPNLTGNKEEKRKPFYCMQFTVAWNAVFRKQQVQPGPALPFLTKKARGAPICHQQVAKVTVTLWLQKKKWCPISERAERHALTLT